MRYGRRPHPGRRHGDDHQEDWTEYIQWRDLVGPGLPSEHARQTARELGFTEEKSDCAIYAKRLPCWSDGSEMILYDAGYEKNWHHTFYLDNAGISKADGN